MSHIDLNALRLLTEIADQGSVGAAAHKLGVSQPAASARLRALESRWQLNLVNRSARGSTLTEDGQTVYVWASTVIEAADTMQAALIALSVQRRGDLIVAASQTVAEFALPRWLAKLRHEQPDVHPQMTVSNSWHVVGQIRKQQADLGFIETPDIPDDVSAHRIGMDQLVIVVDPDHPWSQRQDYVTADELASTELVLREPGSGTRRTFEEAIQQPVRVGLEVGSTASLIAAAQTGAGPAVVSARAASQALAAGTLVKIRNELQLNRPFTAIWNPHHKLRGARLTLLSIATSKK